MARWDVPDTVFPTNNSYDIPLLRDDYQVNMLDFPVLGWGSIARKTRISGTWHFYTDDYRFTALLKHPENILKTRAVACVEPNFSITDHMPMPVALYRIYQKRWLSRYWQQHGIRIIVDLNVSLRYRSLNLLGVPKGWAAYATRGYTDRLDATQTEYELACQHAGTDKILFILYGGGTAVKNLAMDNGWTWLSEQIEEWQHGEKETTY